MESCGSTTLGRPSVTHRRRRSAMLTSDASPVHRAQDPRGHLRRQLQRIDVDGQPADHTEQAYCGLDHLRRPAAGEFGGEGQTVA